MFKKSFIFCAITETFKEEKEMTVSLKEEAQEGGRI